MRVAGPIFLNERTFFALLTVLRAVLQNAMVRFLVRARVHCVCIISIDFNDFECYESSSIKIEYFLAIVTECDAM